MRVRTRQCLTAVTTAAIVISSIGTGVPAMAAKVTLPKTAKVAVGAKKQLKLKNNKQTVKWKVSKGAKNLKIVKKNKKGCTVKGIKKGTAAVQAVVGNKKYTCKVTITAKSSDKAIGSPAVTSSPAAPTTNKPAAPKSP